MREHTLLLPWLLALLAACDDPAEIARYESATQQLRREVEEREHLLGAKDRAREEHELNLLKLREAGVFTDAASFLATARKPQDGVKVSLEVIGGPRAAGRLRWRATCSPSRRRAEIRGGRPTTARPSPP
jgi:hypothetical protein